MRSWLLRCSSFTKALNVNTFQLQDLQQWHRTVHIVRLMLVEDETETGIRTLKAPDTEVGLQHQKYRLQSRFGLLRFGIGKVSDLSFGKLIFGIFMEQKTKEEVKLRGSHLFEVLATSFS